MATVTIFGDTADAGITSSSASTYAAARAGTGNEQILDGPSDTDFSIGQWHSLGIFQVFEGFLAFDTSSITSVPAYGASAQLYCTSDQSDTAEFVVEMRVLDWGTAVELADFVPGANLSGLTLVAQTASTPFTASSYIDFVESGTAFRNAIVLGGMTRLLIHSDRTRTGSSPSTTGDDREFVGFRTADFSGTTTDPKLILVMSADASVDDILNPNVDVTTNSWTTNTGATTELYAAIDETSANDSDYIQSPTGPTSSQYYETALETKADPLSSTGHIVNYRYQKNVSGGNVDLRVGLRQGDGSVLTTNQSTLETSLDVWAASGNNTSVRSTAQAHSGVASIETTGTGGGTSRTQLPTGTSGRPVVPSVPYDVSAWFRSAATARSVGIDIRWYTSAGTFISTTTGPTTTDSSSAWTQASMTGITSPATAAFASIEVYASGSILNEVHYIDDIVLSGPLAVWTHTNISNSWTTQNQTLTAAQADSITNYSDLRLRFTPSMTTSDVVPAKVADRANVNGNTAVTTVDLVLASMTVGNYLIIRTAADNSGGGGAARTITVTNQSGTPIDTATDIAYQQNNDPGAASAGTTCNVVVAKITATSGTVRITYSGSVVQAAQAEEWSGLHATAPPVQGTPVQADGVASTNLASLTDSSVALGNVAYGAIAIEGPNGDTFTQDADSTNGTWTSLTKRGTTNATADTNQTTVGGYKVPTATGSQTYNPTNSVARDSAGILLELIAATPTVRTQVSWANLELPAAAPVIEAWGVVPI